MATQFVITGQRVTLEKTNRAWICTGWEQGLPVARKSISAPEAMAILEKFPHTIRKV
jgi:hypothetical protein